MTDTQALRTVATEGGKRLARLALEHRSNKSSIRLTEPQFAGYLTTFDVQGSANGFQVTLATAEHGLIVNRSVTARHRVDFWRGKSDFESVVNIRISVLPFLAHAPTAVVGHLQPSIAFATMVTHFK